MNEQVGALRVEIPSLPMSGKTGSTRKSKWKPVVCALAETPGEWWVVAQAETEERAAALRASLYSYAKRHEQPLLTAIRVVEGVPTVYAMAHDTENELINAYHVWAYGKPAWDRQPQ